MTTGMLWKELHSNQLRIEYISNEYKNCVVRHFTGKNPWDDERNEVKDADVFWIFASMTPYIESFRKKIRKNFFAFIEKKNNKIHYWRLFGIIPIVGIKTKNNKEIYCLFNCMPILSVKHECNDTKHVWCLFGFIPVLITK